MPNTAREEVVTFFRETYRAALGEKHQEMPELVGRTTLGSNDKFTAEILLAIKGQTHDKPIFILWHEQHNGLIGIHENSFGDGQGMGVLCCGNGPLTPQAQRVIRNFVGSDTFSRGRSVSVPIKP